MSRFDRILGILLYLRGSKSVSAGDLAGRFQVSRRTIYRDIETLSSLGVPVFAERGREGGFQLLAGYFLPPLMFSTKEAISLLLGVTSLRRLPLKPFEQELEIAEQKLLAAMPERLRGILEDASRIVGFEDAAGDVFHPEPPDLTPESLRSASGDSRIISAFLQAILENKAVMFQYRSPYRGQTEELKAAPLGMFWDRNWWYLVGRQWEELNSPRFWRADRVQKIRLSEALPQTRLTFDVQELLEHNWLKSAMESWSREAPVKIQITSVQASRLQQDWYYRHAKFEKAGDHVMMTFGEDNRTIVLELIRWLGPGAELIEPVAWRKQLKEELQQMLKVYGG